MENSGGKEFGWWMWALGTAVSAFSLVSLGQTLFKVGLSPVFAEFVSFYRRLTYPVLEFVFSIVSISLPTWYKDCFVLSFVIFISLWRAAGTLVEEKRPEGLEGRLLLIIVPAVWISVVAAVLSIPLLGIPFLFVQLLLTGIGRERIVAITKSGEKFRGKEGEFKFVDRLGRIFLVGFGIAFGAAVVFFSLNAYFT